jgi:zinc transport system permease protein
MLVVPVAARCAFAKSYRQTVLYSIGFALLFMTAGLFAAFYLGLRPGGTVVLVGVVCLVAILALGGRGARRAGAGAGKARPGGA